MIGWFSASSLVVDKGLDSLGYLTFPRLLTIEIYQLFLTMIRSKRERRISVNDCGRESLSTHIVQL